MNHHGEHCHCNPGHLSLGRNCIKDVDRCNQEDVHFDRKEKEEIKKIKNI